MTPIIKYVIMYISTNNYLDKYDCETDNIDNAMFFNCYPEALDYKNNIDVSYLYEVIDVEIYYVIGQLLDR